MTYKERKIIINNLLLQRGGFFCLFAFYTERLKMKLQSLHEVCEVKLDVCLTALCR